MNNNEVVANLLSRYKNIFSKSEQPDWAVENKINGEKVTPSIPFVGKSYNHVRNKILVYASAENLTYYEYGNSSNNLLESEMSWNRRRHSLDRNKGDFFPNVHMAPINNGGLISAVAYICHKYNLLDVPESPHDFIESLSVDNLCKYSIKTIGNSSTKNIDYINDPDKLNFSLRYIESDLEILKPDYIFIPYSAYNVGQIKNVVSAQLPDCVVIPLYQLTSTVVNCHISPKFSEDKVLKMKNSTPSEIQCWVDNVSINGLKKDGMYYYFLDANNRYRNVLSPSLS